MLRIVPLRKSLHIMPNILIIGATRGLGASLANAYASEPSNTVYGTTRSSAAPSDDKISKAVNWVPNIDLVSPGVGKALVNQLGMLGVGGGMIEKGIHTFDIVV
jgi:NAD(P)-dependent dehydrogenase (short-subunit alcohol dehydrogenase family)